ncbi:MAG TPA: pre-peptidase C-terminal domain-containing protein, partial [Thermoanaerobaculia bacterium]|nr:pre-peptidase C-terminal domain-containing protein [Thermoanaerobaculia bacterium]
PLELGNATALLGLLLSGNRLGGSLPDALGNIEGLSVLWLNGNRFTGPVPIGLAGLVELTDGGGLDLRNNALATDAEDWLREWLDSKQVGGNWTSSQAASAPLEVGASLSHLHDRRPGGFVYWTVEVGAGAPPLTISTAAGGTGNSDLFLRFGAPPTLTQNDGSSTSPTNQDEVTIASPKAGTYYVGLYARSPYRGVTLKAGGSASCFPGGSTLCLSGSRFKVQVAWRTPAGQTGTGQAKALTADTGYFWFFNESNVEMVIKVLDACGVNGKFWVFAGGLTDVQTDITVTDTRTDTVRTYRNPQGTAFQPIQDTSAFATCNAAASTAEPEEVEIAAEKAPCVPGSTTLCLANGRFQVEVGWTRPNGETGTGRSVPLTADTGYFWFFSDTNVEMVIKVLDACGLNNKFWVFAGGLTDVRTEIRVTDTLKGVTKTYTNPQGTAFRPIQDTGAFATCP